MRGGPKNMLIFEIGGTKKFGFKIGGPKIQKY
jgi:hypothetical protein